MHYARHVGKLGDFLLGNYKSVSEELGLTIDGATGVIRGVVDDVPIEMWFGSHATNTRVRLTNEAPVALHVATRSLPARLFGRGANLGHPTFDKLFTLDTANPGNVAKLLSSTTVDLLVEIARKRLRPVVEKDQIRLRMFSQGGSDSREKIMNLLRETARLGKTIDACFAR